MADIKTVFQIFASVKGTEAVKDLTKSIKDVSSKGENMNRFFAQSAVGAKKFGQNIETAALSLKNMGKAFAAMAIVTGAKDILLASDYMTSFNTRIKMSTKSMEEFEYARSRLIQSSEKTGLDLGDSAQVFQRLSYSRDTLGLDVNQMVQFSQGIQKAAALSNTTRENMTAGLLQLGQALSSGIVRAEEFNSIMENIPYVGKIVAEQLGVPADQLRQLVLVGKVASKDLVSAILNATQQINEEFEKLPMTASRGWNVFTIKMRESAALLDENADGSSNVGKMLVWLGDVAKHVANGFGLVVDGLKVFVVGSYKLIVDFINWVNAKVRKSAEEYVTIWQNLYNFAIDAIQKIVSAYKIINSVNPFGGVSAAIDSAADSALSLLESMKSVGKIDFGSQKDLITPVDFLAFVDKVGQARIAAMQKSLLVDAPVAPSLPAKRDYTKDYSKEDPTTKSTKGGDEDGKAAKERNKAAEEAARIVERLRKEQEDAAAAGREWIAKQEASVQALKDEASYAGKTSSEIERLKMAREMDIEAAEKTANMSEANKEAFLKEAEAVKNLKIAQMELNEEIARKPETGAKDFFTDYVQKATDGAQQIKDVLTDAFSGAEDALVDFITTGKFSFTDMANSIIKDLARIVVQKTITGPLASWMGGFFASANGNVMTGSGPVALQRYATGGIARSAQVSLFGEGSQPEAYVPLPDGRSIPVSMKGGSGATVNTPVTINYQAASGGNASTSRSDAQTMAKIVTQQVREVLLNEKRAGGILAGSR